MKHRKNTKQNPKYQAAAIRSRATRLLNDNPQMPKLERPVWSNDKTQDIPSHGPTKGNTDSKPSTKYTGSLIIGIGTMHKSNAVPVINEQEAKDIAKMRR